ncbi:predicted protein [Thalassiosira pseudonana CCMP1335]|uniref:Ion transport domain-containing protein n=1 Tax=Thalassiosira pseudonana TaxID=35128 RepID=B8C5D9_THAPS|nr:predicted protein [Thalassiosira pseudonana CCMP1335]EED91493.1 predicted protein [Thalassiosira pseudonana CCMP1335]|eukprot:scaffold13325_cov287-Alexandrium_tamarense.AAC.2
MADDYRRYHSPTEHQKSKTKPTSPNNGGGHTTDLHKACSSPSSSLSKLRATLLALGKSSAAQRDEEGRLPLHLLGRNELLIHLFLNQARYDVTGVSESDGYGVGVWGGDDLSVGQNSAGMGLGGGGGGGATSAMSLNGIPGMLGGSGASRPPKTELDSFVIELTRAYPRAMISTDSSGRIPLTDSIYDWIDYSSRDVPLDAGEGGAPGGGENGARGGAERYEGPSNLGMGSARDGGGRDTSHLGSDRLEGMSQLMGADEDDRVTAGSRKGGETSSIQRSVLTNLSLPSAFRSAYSASGEVDGSQKQSRATYRDSNNSIGDDPAARQQAEFRNVWSATTPRPDGPSDEGSDRRQQFTFNNIEAGSAGPNSPGRGPCSRISGARGGQSDIHSNPPEDAAIDDVFPLNLAMPPVVEWSLRMISIILDGIESYGGPLGADNSEAFEAWREDKQAGDLDATSGDFAWIGNSLVSAIASIPSFMKTLLLLNDSDPVKARVFNLSIVRRAISSKYTIGNWLVYMLEAVDPIVARRGVDYLEILSEDEDENALIPSTKRVRFAGTQLAPAQRAALYYKVSRLDYFLPAILALEETVEVDRASKTKLLRHILDKELGSRPTLTMAFFDLFFLVMLLVTFQMSVYHVVDGYGHTVKYFITYYLSMVGVLYAILRKFGQMSSMIKISRQAFIDNNFRWEDGVDWLAIGLTIGGIVWMEVAIATNYQLVPVTDYMRSYLAAAICAIWLKLVSWLSVINWQVVNLVQLLYQIFLGMRWILLFLLIAVLASSQMFYVMLSGQCDNGDNGFCEQKNAYLQVWSILLGQFDINDFDTTFSVIAFVAFTFVTFVILGYAIVATAIDIYNKAVTFRSENSAYGNRSRLVYIAELRAFRRLFDQRWTLMQYCAALLFLTSIIVVFLFAAVEIRNSLGEFYSGGILGGAVALLMVFLFVSIMAFVSHMTYYSFVENSGAQGCGSTLCRILAANGLVRLFAHPFEQLMRSIVDIDGIHLDGTPSTAKYTDSWQGSATHIRCHVKRMLMQSEVHMSIKMRNELLAMELRNKKANERSRSDVLTEIRASEERIERIISDFQGWMERRMAHDHDD